MSTALSMVRGDTKTVQTTISGLSSSGLAGYSFWFTAKHDLQDADASAVIAKTTPDFTVQQVGNASTPGIITCTIAPADTANLVFHDTILEWDVQIKDGSGTVTTVATGTLAITADATRATS